MNVAASIVTREVRDALERLYVNVRAEYPFSVRDREIVEVALDRLSARLQQSEKIVLKRGQEIDRQLRRAEAAEAREAVLREALTAIESMAGAGGSGEIPAMAIAARARRALATPKEGA